MTAPRTMEALVAARAGERDKMRGLTDRLAALVGKVRGLEAQNTVLRVRVTESREERREREFVLKGKWAEFDLLEIPGREMSGL